MILFSYFFNFQRAEWENEVRQIKISILPEMVDPAPFQIVDNTSLFKVHLFQIINKLKISIFELFSNDKDIQFSRLTISNRK